MNCLQKNQCLHTILYSPLGTTNKFVMYILKHNMFSSTNIQKYFHTDTSDDTFMNVKFAFYLQNSRAWSIMTYMQYFYFPERKLLALTSDKGTQDEIWQKGLPMYLKLIWSKNLHFARFLISVISQSLLPFLFLRKRGASNVFHCVPSGQCSLQILNNFCEMSNQQCLNS